MAIKNPKELFTRLLSEVRQREERTMEILQEVGQAANHPDIKEALEFSGLPEEPGDQHARSLLQADQRKAHEGR